MDIDSIEPGVDFVKAIAEAVGRSQVLVALIGPQWLAARDHRGNRRLDDPGDPVVLELTVALERGIRVIPVLVDGTEMPRRDELPAALESLAQRNAMRLDHEQFRSHATQLLQVLESSLGQSRARRTTPEDALPSSIALDDAPTIARDTAGRGGFRLRLPQMVIGMAVAAGALLAALVLIARSCSEDDDSTSSTTSSSSTSTTTPGVIERFALVVGDEVSPGVVAGAAAPGAGSLPTPGVSDIYTFDAAAGQAVFLDLTAGCETLDFHWKVGKPGEEPVFEDYCRDRGPIELEESGPYELTVWAVDATTGDYSFQLWDVPPPERFALVVGDEVSPGVVAGAAAPGAGSLPTPGVSDIYTFDAAAGQAVFLDLTAGCETLDFRWKVGKPGEEPVFEDYCRDRGPIELEESGPYELTVWAVDATTGDYSFQLWDVPPPERFALVVGDEVSPGVVAGAAAPGAGSLPTPGVSDIYTFDAAAGQAVFLDLTAGCETLDFRWKVGKPGEEPVFEDYCRDRGPIELEESGPYELTVWAVDATTGDYSFQLRAE